MLLEQYESTTVDRNTWLNVPSGTYGLPKMSSGVHAVQCWEQAGM